MSDIALEGQSGEAVSVQTDPVSSFSFEGLHEKALEAFEKGDTPGETPEHVDPSAATADPVEPVTNIDNASAAKLATIADDQLVELNVDGEKVQMAWKDAKNGFQRQAHYTKSMQELRREQSQFETDRASLSQDRENLGVLRNLLTNADLLKQFVAKQHPSLLQAQQELQNAAAAADPNDIATVGQIQAAQQALLTQQQQAHQQFLQQLAEREETLTRNIEDRQATAKLSADINTTITSLFNEHKHIADLIPNANQVLRYEVLQLKPSTAEETVEAFKTVFGGWVEKYNATVKATTKQNVIEKHKLSTNNIQPPGGAPPQPEPTSFKKVNKMTGKTEVNWDAIRAASLDALNQK